MFSDRVQEQDDKRKKAEQAKRERVAKVEAAGTAAREVAAEALIQAQKKTQDQLAHDLLGICTDPKSKDALAPVVGGLVRHQVDRVTGSEFAEVWRAEESLEGAVVLAEAIGYCRSLKTLDMSRHYCRSLKTLDRSRCRVISAEGWDVLLREGVAKSVSLTDLNLSHNCLGGVGGEAVGKALRVNTVLRTLNLSLNGLGEVGGKAVGEALRVNTVLQTLDLSWNRLGKVGGQGYRLAEPLATH
jgi:hypothetical protein